jgi:translation initiation factor 5A
MEVPNITRKEFSIMSIDGEGYTTLMDTGTSELRTDIRLPDDTDEDLDLSKKLKEAVEEGKNILVTVLAAMNIEKIVEFKEA